MATPERTLTIVAPAKQTNVALRALSSHERRECWRLFFLLVEVARRRPRGLFYVETSIEAELELARERGA